jgi:ribosome-binding protein aMBF1 (putative translation factor)
MNRTALNVQLRRMREKRGMTVEQVAKKLKCGVWWIKDIERGNPAANHVWLARYLKALNCHCIVNGPDGAFVVSENQDVGR